MTDDELLALVKKVDSKAVRLPHGIKEIAAEIESAEREACLQISIDEMDKRVDDEAIGGCSRIAEKISARGVPPSSTSATEFPVGHATNMTQYIIWTRDNVGSGTIDVGIGKYVRYQMTEYVNADDIKGMCIERANLLMAMPDDSVVKVLTYDGHEEVSAAVVKADIMKNANCWPAGAVGTAEYRAEQGQKNREARGLLDAVASVPTSGDPNKLDCAVAVGSDGSFRQATDAEQTAYDADHAKNTRIHAAPPAPDIDRLMLLLAHTVKEADGWFDESRGGQIDDDPLMDEARALVAGVPPELDPDSLTGNRTILDAAAIMLKRKADVLRVLSRHDGKRIDIELRILRVEDHE